MRNETKDLPISKPCPSLPGCVCTQGMVLEIDPHHVDEAPIGVRYRCQDCDRREELCVEVEEFGFVPVRDGKLIHAEFKCVDRYYRIVAPNNNDIELLS